MATRMQQRRGTASQWTTANPILGPGEIGFETDTNKFKIGDGVARWATLSYFLDEDALGGSLGDYVPLTDVGEPDGVAELDSTGNVPLSQLGNVQEVNLATYATIQYVDDEIAAIPAPDYTGLATETYVNTAVSNLVDSAPGALDTLNELAAALGDDASFAATITNALGDKQDKVSGVSDTEIGYLDGVTSAIQTQLDGKAATSHTHAIADVTNLQSSLEAKADLIDGYVDPSQLNQIGSTTQQDVYVAMLSEYDIVLDEWGDPVEAEVGTYSVYSSDLVTWQQSNLTDSPGMWNNIAYGNGKFVAVSDTNAGAYSTDGISWSATTLPLNQARRGLAFGNGKFVALGDSGEIEHSSDGVSWSQTALTASSEWYTVLFLGGKFIVPKFSFSSNSFAYSTDGVSWTYSTLPSAGDWTRFLYANGIYLAIAPAFGVSYKSNDLASWTQITPTITQAFSDGDAFYRISAGNFQRSLDLSTWNTLSTFPTTATADGFSFVNDKFVFWGDGDDADYYTDKIITSTDGITWTTQTPVGLPASYTFLTSNTQNGIVGTSITSVNNKNIATEDYVDDAIAAIPPVDISGKQDKVANVSDTEIGYLDGVTSAIQTQINGKANTTHTHAIADVTNLQTSLDAKANLAGPTFTGNVVLPGTTTIGNVSATELGFVDGVTSAIQTQINGKANTSHTHAISDVTNLQTALDGKAAAPISQSVSTNITAVANAKYFVNTSAARTITLPASPALGDEIQIFDAIGTAGTNIITVNNNSNRINGVIDTALLDANGVAAVFVWTGSTYGWRMG